MEGLYPLCTEPVSDDHHKTQLYTGACTFDGDSFAGGSGAEQRKELPECLLSVCYHDSYRSGSAVPVFLSVQRNQCKG